jgi:S-adenosylmethionine:tRNA ribosyltransferase-isomerase
MPRPDTPTTDLLYTDHYDYDLPKDLIAQHPLPNREDARLLVVNRTMQSIDHCHVRNLPEILQSGDCLVLNDTKVIPAKITGLRTQTGGRWQGLYLDEDEAGNWKVLCKTRGNIQPGETVTLQDRHGRESVLLHIVAQLEDKSWVVRPESELSTPELLEIVGRIPLPNYIRSGNMVDADIQDYQTVFAKKPGAVAAPTAGLHLTEPLLNRLINEGINIAKLTLHVGIGTFRPVKTERLENHEMHTEWGSIGEEAVGQIKSARQNGRRVVAVGTTSIRVLETAAAGGDLQPWTGETNLFIRPPYDFKAATALMTNFHLPRSTLLVLIRAFGGDELMVRAYQAAIEEKYRFYSYGDATIILD